MAIVTNAAVNSGVYVSFWSMIFSGDMPKSGIAGTYGNSIFNLRTLLTVCTFLVVQLVKNSACNAGDPGSITGLGRSPGERIGYPLQYSWASLVAQLVKNPPVMWETWVQSLGWDYPLEEGMATHSSVLAWRIPMEKEAWQATVHRVTKSRTWQQLSTSYCSPGWLYKHIQIVLIIFSKISAGMVIRVGSGTRHWPLSLL